MMILHCPWCGARPEAEFLYGGEVVPPRTALPDDIDDDAWVDWLTGRRNLRGPLDERWWHQKGCGLWFVAVRHTVTHEFIADGPVAP